MLARLAPTLVRRRRLVFVIGIVLIALAGAFGGGVAERLTTGGFEDPAAESSQAADYLEDIFDTGEPQVVLVATAVDGDTDSPASQAAGLELIRRVGAEPGVAEVAGYWSLGNPPPLASSGGDRALVLVRLAGDEDQQDETATRLRDDYEGSFEDTLDIAAGGEAVVFGEIGHTIESDLIRAELIVLPITLVLLVLIFGSVVAAALPLLVGVVAVLGTFASLQVISMFTDVSIYALNLTTALGLGLAIDYSLFVVSRFREELAAGRDTRSAVERTVCTAGRTVLFSAATVAISLAALLVFPLTFLRSFAFAGIAVSATAALGAVVLLPAVLAMLGHRVNALRLFNRRATTSATEGRWHRIATWVMRRPVSIATASVIVLLVLGLPFLRIAFGLPDDRVLPPGNEVRTTQDVLRSEFTGNEAGALEVVLLGTDAADPAVATAATQWSTLPGVARVDSAAGTYVAGELVSPPDATGRFAALDTTWVNVVPSLEPLSAEGEQLVAEVRAVGDDLVADGVADDVLVGGSAAQLVDSKASLLDRLPWALAIIAITTFIVLFLLFGSVLVPLKALVLNMLSLSATFGAMVWVFQDGNLSGLLDFTATGAIDTTMPILMFCIAFGLSMDYEVFLLSRIKEEHDRGADTVTSVAVGLERTGRIVTAAAVLMAVVFFAFGTSGVSFLKMFGFGLALAVLMDAFVIRTLLVPSFMRLAGDANWWAPGWMRAIHDRFGISEHDDLDDDPTGESTDEEVADERPQLVGMAR